MFCSANMGGLKQVKSCLCIFLLFLSHLLFNKSEHGFYYNLHSVDHYRKLHQNINPAVFGLLCLRQGNRTIENYVVDFLELSWYVDFNEDIFCVGLNEPIHSQMPGGKIDFSLAEYIDYALLLSGSSFTAGTMDKESHNSLVPTTSAKPEDVHVMPAKPEPLHIMATTPESSAKMAATPEPRHITATMPHDRHTRALSHHSHFSSALSHHGHHTRSSPCLSHHAGASSHNGHLARVCLHHGHPCLPRRCTLHSRGQSSP